jgi:hypothetical protein
MKKCKTPMLQVANFGAYAKKKVHGPEMVADKENTEAQLAIFSSIFHNSPLIILISILLVYIHPYDPLSHGSAEAWLLNAVTVAGC